MSKQREAMEMALKVIDDINTKYAIGGYIITLSKAKSMLLEALADDERKPLTDEQIKSMWGMYEYREYSVEFAREIELAHGIGD